MQGQKEFEVFQPKKIKRIDLYPSTQTTDFPTSSSKTAKRSVIDIPMTTLETRGTIIPYRSEGSEATEIETEQVLTKPEYATSIDVNYENKINTFNIIINIVLGITVIALIVSISVSIALMRFPDNKILFYVSVISSMIFIFFLVLSIVSLCIKVWYNDKYMIYLLKNFTQMMMSKEQ